GYPKGPWGSVGGRAFTAPDPEAYRKRLPDEGRGRPGGKCRKSGSLWGYLGTTWKGGPGARGTGGISGQCRQGTRLQQFSATGIGDCPIEGGPAGGIGGRIRTIGQCRADSRAAFNRTSTAS